MAIHSQSRPDRIWSVAHAKAQFSAVLEEAERQGPQIITRHGRETAVIVSIDEWKRRAKPDQSLLEFFRTSPLWGSELQIERIRGDFRPVELE